MLTPHDLMVPPADPTALITSTWEELGGVVTPHGPRLWVRTWSIPEKIGLIYLPQVMRNVYKGLPHSKLVRATVLCEDRRWGFKAGDHVCFGQTFFARYKHMIDGTLTGFLHPKYVHGRIVLEDEDLVDLREVQEGRACAA